MFLKKLYECNPQLIETSVKLHQEGKILPDTFVVDYDQFVENAKSMLALANEKHVELFYMLKQVGRNPLLAKALEDLGYAGAVVVDYKEARVLMKHGLHIAHIGHLVQVPNHYLEEVMRYGCKYMTVYSIEKLQLIDKIAKKLNQTQKVFVRVIDPNDHIYSGQTAGFYLDELEEFAKQASMLENVDICGVTSFPCFLYDETKNDIVEQHNYQTVLKAKQMLNSYGLHIHHVNAPSATCYRTLEKVVVGEVQSMEPGHGLTGTTPYHLLHQTKENIAICYVSEVSHNLDGKAYVYGGGFYRRGHLEHALVGNDFKNLRSYHVITPSLESIDYHFGLNQQAEIGESVIMAFRFQIFVTRSDVCIVKGVKTGNPQVIGVFSSLAEVV